MTLPPNPDEPQQPQQPQQAGDTGAGQPAADQTGAGQPSADQPNSGQPGAGQYGADQPPAAPQYAPPQPPPHGAPQYAPPQPGQPQYAPPPQSQYAAPPQQPQYGSPQQPYGASQPHPYGAPQYQSPYGAPPYQPPYGAPQFPSAAGIPPSAGGPYDGAVDPDDTSRPLYGASFGQAVKRFFRGYAKFTGRASRSEYWFSALFVFLVQLVPLIIYFIGIGVVASSSYRYDSYSAGPSAGGIFLLIAGLALLILIGLGLLLPSIAVAWRRLHDGNFAGPLYFLSFIPYAGGIILLVFMLMPSKAEGRRFDYA